MIGNEVPYRKEDTEKDLLIPNIQPVRNIHAIRKISAGLFNRERRELMYTYARNRRKKLTKRINPVYKRTEQLTRDERTTEKIEQEFRDYKLEIKNRMSFDRAQILNEELSSY